MPNLVNKSLAFLILACVLQTMTLWGQQPAAIAARTAVQVLESRLIHLRALGPREWSDFAEEPMAKRLRLAFSAKATDSPWTLCLTQQDVKQSWQVSLNGKSIGRLVRDENKMTVYFELPAEAIREGDNLVVIEQDSKGRQTPDDIRVGAVTLDRRPLSQATSGAVLDITVASDQTKATLLPSRITILNDSGALQSTATQTHAHLAVRPGVVFTSTGRARVTLPPGRYRVFAGRGFEYSVDEKRLTVGSGQTRRLEFALRREVATPGYAACDTHVHTLTHSGHGDSTVEERMITLAAEGIELPIATDHNVNIDHRPFAERMKVSAFFTPIIGNEVTTTVGHFNVFPIRKGASPPNHKLKQWGEILDGIYGTPGVKVAILNHARDLHSNVRPFGPRLFNEVVGEMLDDRAVRFNAMEVVNSGATQTDALRLFHDWMALLNRGRLITPVGSSDSHDVARHFVGQGRTYVRCDDRIPGNINIEQAVANFVQGRVMVSYGLLTEIKINDNYGPGELAHLSGDKVKVSVRVLGPHWVHATHVALYANGIRIRQQEIPQSADAGPSMGIKWQQTWTLDRPAHDVHLVAIATGPGIKELYWPTAKAYQPTSSDWQARVIGCSGAVWLDADGDGARSSARKYAEQMWSAADHDLVKLVGGLSKYDEAVAAQAAHIAQTAGVRLLTSSAQAAIKNGTEATQQGFRNYLNAWRKNQQAQTSR